MKKVLFILLCVVVIAACTHSPSTVVTPGNHDTTVVVNPIDSPAITTDTSVCFQRDVLPIFIGSCAKTGCHDAITRAEGYNLSNYTSIISKGLVKFNSATSKIYKVCKSNEMPESPTPKLDSTQLSYLRRWIDKGAPNDTDCIVLCDTTKFTYTTAIAPILKTYCKGCHATAVAASSGGGVILDTYNGVLTQAQNGKLMGDINHATGFNAMPLGGSKLPDCQITQIRRWIAAGALNN